MKNLNVIAPAIPDADIECFLDHLVEFDYEVITPECAAEIRPTFDYCITAVEREIYSAFKMSPEPIPVHYLFSYDEYRKAVKDNLIDGTFEICRALLNKLSKEKALEPSEDFVFHDEEIRFID